MDAPHIPNELRSLINSLCHQTLRLIVTRRKHSVVDTFCYGIDSCSEHRIRQFNAILSWLNDTLSHSIRTEQEYYVVSQRLHRIRLMLTDIMFPYGTSDVHISTQLHNMLTNKESLL